MIRLICTDIDGTLVEDGGSTLPQGFAELVKELKKRGIIFAAASGRPYSSIRHLFGEVADDIVYICESGSLVIDKGEVLYSKCIDRAEMIKILEYMRSKNGSDYFASGIKRAYCEHAESKMHKWVRDDYKTDLICVEDILKVDDEIIELEFYNDVDAEKAIGEEFLKKYDGSNGVKAMNAGYMWVVCIRSDAGKGEAVRAVCQKYGIKKDEVMAFGDSQNDVDMLLAAEESYAMETARDEIKRAAKYTAPNWQHNGVYNTIKEALKIDI